MDKQTIIQKTLLKLSTVRERDMSTIADYITVIKDNPEKIYNYLISYANREGSTKADKVFILKTLQAKGLINVANAGVKRSWERVVKDWAVVFSI